MLIRSVLPYADSSFGQGAGRDPSLPGTVVTPSDQTGAGGVVCLCRCNPPANSDLELRLFPL